MKAHTPSVSVILPTYNRAYVLDRAVQSVLNQTYTDFELIIIDDGSNDGTVDLVEGYADERVHLLRHERRKGAAAARNTGVRASRGKWIAFQDSDDIWLAEKLERQLSLLQKAGKACDVVYTRMWRYSWDTLELVPKLHASQCNGNLLESILDQAVGIGVPSVLLRRNCFGRAGLFNETLHCMSDYEFWIRIAPHTEFALLDHPLVLSIQQPDSLTSDLYDGKRVVSMEQVLREHTHSFQNRLGSRAVMYFWMGRMCCFTGRKARARRCLKKALRLNRLGHRPLLWMLVSFLSTRQIQTLRALKRRIRTRPSPQEIQRRTEIFSSFGLQYHCGDWGR